MQCKDLPSICQTCSEVSVYTWANVPSHETSTQSVTQARANSRRGPERNKHLLTLRKVSTGGTFEAGL